MEPNFICIDLKSFYASVECVERGLDPFRVNLVVADPTRSKSTICLAITPAMKKLGVKNRCRVHEIPPGIEYITAMPRMQLYIDYSARIYSIYLRFLAPEDIHVYSIDECFMDVTHYRALYGKDAPALAREMREAVFRETGITASAGIGTNLYLAKIAMDILAKRTPDGLAVLDEESYRAKLWDHQPLTDFWQIGRGTVRRLEPYGIRSMREIAETSQYAEDLLYRQFGVEAEYLIDHAWGRESCRMEDIKSYRTRSRSLSVSQVLMRNYGSAEAAILIREMADQLSLDLVDKGLTARALVMQILYDHKLEKAPSGGSISLETETNRSSRIIRAADRLYRRIVDPGGGIRRLYICCGYVQKEEVIQSDLFSDPEEAAKERRLQKARLEIRKRFGKNSLLRGISYTEASTLRERNGQIGGHRA